ncbi:inositol monophosphatase family protein [Laceyella putida]|uniref:Inositol monophosphatase family protein n=1 Tax=Laceyella putida TaxID=110101 RepID=A0ABW2RKW9_9BACL
MGEAREMLSLTQEWVREAGTKIRAFLAVGTVRFETKSRKNDLVTEMDRETERFLVEKIMTHFPEHRIMGEEGITERPERFDGYVWFIDPIDGTSNFVTQGCDFVISIALYHGREGILAIVYDVMRDEMIYTVRGEGVYLNGHQCPSLAADDRALIDSLVAVEFIFRSETSDEYMSKIMELGPHIRGFRVFGATALAMAKVAVGRVQAFVTAGTNPWDFAAGKMLIEAAGGRVSDLRGECLVLEERCPVLASVPSIYGELRDWIAK